MLGRTVIESLIANGDLKWTGPLRGNSLLLSLTGPALAMNEGTEVVDPKSIDSVDRAYGPVNQDWSTLDILPGAFMLMSCEPVVLPNHVAGLISTLSHLARLGVASHMASSFVAAGFAGHLTLEIANHSPRIVRIHRGMPVARLLLFDVGDVQSSSTTSYGGAEDLRSQYPKEFGHV